MSTGTTRRHLLILTLLFVVAAMMRIAAPADLFKGDQEKQVGYVMDILRNGNWVTQYEVTGKIATKPPFYNWCAAVLCMAVNRTDPLLMRLPSLFAGAGLIALIYLLGRRLLEPEAAFWAAAAAIASHHVMKLMWFARTDMLMVFILYAAIGLTVLVRARWWLPLLIGAVLGIGFLTKGPVAPALYAVWLAIWAIAHGTWRDRQGWLKVAAGAIVLAIITGAWTWAVWEMPGFRSTVIEGELGSRFEDGRRAKPLWYYVPLLLQRIAPWSLLAIVGAKLCWRRANEPRVKLIVAWAVTFFLVFSLLPAKRHDLLLPVYPPVFLLAGLGMREILRLAAVRWLWWAAVGLAAATGIGALALAGKVGGMLAWEVAIAGAFTALLVAMLAGRQRWRAAFIAVCLLLILVIGLESWQRDEETQAYLDLVAFLQPLQAPAREGQVIVMNTHPLVSYVLGLHRHEPILSAMERRQAWLLGGRDEQQYLTAPGWQLSSIRRLRNDEVALELYVYELTPK